MKHVTKNIVVDEYVCEICGMSGPKEFIEDHEKTADRNEYNLEIGDIVEMSLTDCSCEVSRHITDIYGVVVGFERLCWSKHSLYPIANVLFPEDAWRYKKIKEGYDKDDLEISFSKKHPKDIITDYERRIDYANKKIEELKKAIPKFLETIIIVRDEKKVKSMIEDAKKRDD